MKYMLSAQIFEKDFICQKMYQKKQKSVKKYVNKNYQNIRPENLSKKSVPKIRLKIPSEKSVKNLSIMTWHSISFIKA